MKSMQKNLVLLLVATSSLFTGCSRDVEAVDKQKREEIQARSRNNPNRSANNKQTSGPRSNKATVKLGTFSFVPFLAEKHSEVITLFLAAHDAKNEKPFEFTVDFSTAENLNLVNKRLLVNQKSQIFGEFLQDHQAIWDVQLTKSAASEDASIDYAEVELQAGKVTLDLQSKPKDNKDKKYVNAFKNQAKLKVFKREDNTFSFNYIESGSMVTAKDGLREDTPYKMTLNMSVKIDSRNSEKMEINHSTVNFVLARDQEFRVEYRTKSNLVFYNKECPFVAGEVSLQQRPPKRDDKNQKPLPPKIFVIEENQTYIKDSNWKIATAPCGQRPTVDYSKILFY
ncbi:MAG: hypothetical protein ACLGGX_06620 [Bdellovibrionia bacterium]